MRRAFHRHRLKVGSDPARRLQRAWMRTKKSLLAGAGANEVKSLIAGERSRFLTLTWRDRFVV